MRVSFFTFFLLLCVICGRAAFCEPDGWDEGTAVRPVYSSAILACAEKTMDLFEPAERPEIATALGVILPKLTEIESAIFLLSAQKPELLRWRDLCLGVAAATPPEASGWQIALVIHHFAHSPFPDFHFAPCVFKIIKDVGPQDAVKMLGALEAYVSEPSRLKLYTRAAAETDPARRLSLIMTYYWFDLRTRATGQSTLNSA